MIAYALERAAALREAGDLAGEAGLLRSLEAIDPEDRSALANARLDLGTRFLQSIEESEETSPQRFQLGVQATQAATQALESLGTIRFYSALFILARYIELGESDPRGIYARITRDLANLPLEFDDDDPQLRDFMRGRAYLELARLEDDLGNAERSAEWLEAGRELIEASGLTKQH
jgi:hypothetical protein